MRTHTTKSTHRHTQRPIITQRHVLILHILTN